MFRTKELHAIVELKTLYQAIPVSKLVWQSLTSAETPDYNNYSSFKNHKKAMNVYFQLKDRILARQLPQS